MSLGVRGMAGGGGKGVYSFVLNPSQSYENETYTFSYDLDEDPKYLFMSMIANTLTTYNAQYNKSGNTFMQSMAVDFEAQKLTIITANSGTGYQHFYRTDGAEYFRYNGWSADQGPSVSVDTNAKTISVSFKSYGFFLASDASMTSVPVRYLIAVC